MERERVTVQQAAARLGITESAVRKRVRKGDLRSEKVLEGKRERLYVFLDPDAEPFPEPFREKYMRSLEERVKTLEDEVMRQQAIILSMSQSLRALTRAPEAPQGVEEAQEETEPSRPSAGGERETARPSTPSARASRLGMSTWALAGGAIATLLTWSFVFSLLFDASTSSSTAIEGSGPFYLVVALGMLVPLFFGLLAGSTKRPSLSWFGSPYRWWPGGGQSVLRIATFAAGMPAWVAFLIAWVYLLSKNMSVAVPSNRGELLLVILIGAFCGLPLAIPLALLPFMSGAFLGNALRRVGFLGPPKEPRGEEDREEVWSPRKEARWGLAGTLTAALISALASLVAAYIGN